jgi:beta-lactamase regulating signal transducer with metallopeptidase domain
MSAFAIEPDITGVLWWMARASALLAVAAAVQLALWRRGSAASRHFIWTLALVGLLLLPLAARTMPSWPIAVSHVAPAALTDVAAVVSAAPGLETSAPASVAGPGSATLARSASPAAVSWPSLAAAAYVVIAAALLILVVFEQWRVHRFGRRAAVVTDPEWLHLLTECADRLAVSRPVRLLRSADAGVPAAIGSRQPAIVIPSSADDWLEDRRRAVLLHEMAHVARRDCLTQLLASVACAVYWCHPAVWWIASRLRIERELACDDRVIAAGTDARDYARHLLEIAYAFGRRRAPALVVSMARPRQLEGRMLAALDDDRNRTAPGPWTRAAVAVAAACVMTGIAIVTPVAAPLAPSLAPAAQVRTDGNRLPGTWQIAPSRTEGTIHLTIVELRSTHGRDVPLSQLDGLTAAQLASGGPVTFRLRRDAGTFTFEGVARGGVAGGTFTFAPTPTFAADLAKRGFAAPAPQEQYDLARADVGFAFIDELTRQGYAKPSTADLVRAGQHGVSTTYLREMGELGHRLGTLEPLITLRDHGVTPDYIRGLADEGHKKLSADELRRARDHGVSVEYIRGMREAGYASLPLDGLIRTRDHGVSPEYVRQLADAGYRKLPLEEVVRVRDHGVSIEFVRDMRQLGYSLSLDDLVRARDHGVSTEYIRELQKLGYEKLPLDDLIGLRDHGMSAEKIRDANKRAGTRLPLDLLKALAGVR